MQRLMNVFSTLFPKDKKGGRKERRMEGKKEGREGRVRGKEGGRKEGWMEGRKGRREGRKGDCYH